jgi:cobalt-zinc-cadmium efflux system outer membrane protein
MAMEAQVRAAEADWKRALSDRHQAMSAAYAAAKTLQEILLPVATEAFDVTQEGYRRGRFGYLDLLEAQRLLFENRKQHIEAVRAYHRAAAGVQRMAPAALPEPTRLDEGDSR